MTPEEKARQLAVAAKGRKVRLRIEEHATIPGTVVLAVFVGWVTSRKRLQAKFRIHVIPDTKTVLRHIEHIYHTTKLPHPESDPEEYQELKVLEFKEETPTAYM